MRNIPGIELCSVDRLGLLTLAPGGHLGRFIIWTKAGGLLRAITQPTLHIPLLVRASVRAFTGGLLRTSTPPTSNLLVPLSVSVCTAFTRKPSHAPVSVRVLVFNDTPALSACSQRSSCTQWLSYKGAFEKLDSIYGTAATASSAKKGWKPPANIMAMPDLSRVINSDEIQSAVNPMKDGKTRAHAPLKRNPLKNKAAMERLNPYAKVGPSAGAAHFTQHNISSFLLLLVLLLLLLLPLLLLLLLIFPLLLSSISSSSPSSISSCSSSSNHTIPGSIWMQTRIIGHPPRHRQSVSWVLLLVLARQAAKERKLTHICGRDWSRGIR